MSVSPPPPTPLNLPAGKDFGLGTLEVRVCISANPFSRVCLAVTGLPPLAVPMSYMFTSSMRQRLSSVKGDTALKNKKQQEARRGKTLREEEAD